MQFLWNNEPHESRYESITTARRNSTAVTREINHWDIYSMYKGKKRMPIVMYIDFS